MARKDRTGNRKTREQRQPLKIPELGYYLVVTDTEATERCYFQGLHKELPKDIQNKLVIKVVETKTRVMIDKCLEMTAYDAQYRMPWIVFDRDEVKDFDEIIKEAEALGINLGWSNPCFEIWMYSYYGAMPAIMESWVCCDEFEKIFQRKTGQKYSKSDAGLYEKRGCNNFMLNFSIAPVIYNDIRFDATTYLSTVLQDYLCKVSQIPMELYHEDTLIISKCLLTKSKDWEYEKEWRLFSRAYNEQYKPYRMLTQLRPKALFMGVKMDKEKELELYSICKEKKIKCYKMLQDFQGKEFTVSAVPYEQIITWGEMKKLGIV